MAGTNSLGRLNEALFAELERLEAVDAGDEGGRIKLKGEQLHRRDGEFAVDYEYSIEYLVFRKGMRI